MLPQTNPTPQPAANPQPNPNNFDRWADLDSLGLSQIYLSARKIARVRGWFRADLANFHPLPVRDFGDGRLTLTDGHTRAFVAWSHGLSRVPVLLDEDDMVSLPPGDELYRSCIAWCARRGLRSIADLYSRVLCDADYQVLWLDRCAYLFNWVSALCRGTLPREEMQRKQAALEGNGLFVCGLSNDFLHLLCEDAAGTPVEVPIGAETNDSQRTSP